MILQLSNFSLDTRVSPDGLAQFIRCLKQSKDTVLLQCVERFNAFTPEGAKAKIDKFFKITKSAKLNKTTAVLFSKVLLSSFPINGHTLGFRIRCQKLGNFVSPKVSLRDSKG